MTRRGGRDRQYLKTMEQRKYISVGNKKRRTLDKQINAETN